MTTKQALFVGGLVVVPTALWVAFAFGHFGRKANLARLTQSFAPQMEEWNQQNFIKIESTTAFRTAVDSVAVSPIDHGLTPAQVVGIRSSLYAALLAYNQGTFEAFRRFRVSGLDFELEPGLADYLRRESDKSGLRLPSAPLDQLELYWSNHIKQRFVGLWKEVSLSTSIVEIQSATSEIPDLHDYVAKHTNAGMASGGPILVVPVNAELIRSKAGQVVYATASAMVRGEGTTYPVYWRYVWHADSSQWVVIDMTIAYSGPRKETPIF